MRKNGTPGAFGKGRPTTNRPATPKGCKFRQTEVWCVKAESCPTCSTEMARRANVNNLRQTAELAHMMRQARTV